MAGLPFKNRGEYAAATTFGQVVENENGQLVCRFSQAHKNWSHDSEMYFQLSAKKVIKKLFTLNVVQWSSKTDRKL